MTIVTQYRTGTRRNTELALLMLSVFTSLACYTMVGIGASSDTSIPANVFGYGLGLGLATMAFHTLVRWKAPYADPVLLPIAATLNGIGLAMIHRIDLAQPDSSALAPKQLMWSIVGMLGAAAVLYFVKDHRVVRRYTYITGILAIALLLLPLIPYVGHESKGALIWVKIGGMTFQPGEITKIVLTAFLAAYLVSNRDQLALAGKKVLGIQLPRLRDLGPVLVASAGAVGILVIQRDLGTSLLLFGIFVALIYVATERISWIIIGLTLFSAAVVVAFVSMPHFSRRVDAWLNAFDADVYDRKYGSYQLVQGIFGMAKGGLLGTGLGEGNPAIIPSAWNDFIYAALGEELGMVGLFAIIVMYIVLVERALRTAIGVRDGFGKLFASGLGFSIALQCFVVIGGITRVIPLTGLSLPLLAYGGSSLVSNWIIVAILLRMSDAARRPAPKPELTMAKDDNVDAQTQAIPAAAVAAAMAATDQQQAAWPDPETTEVRKPNMTDTPAEAIKLRSRKSPDTAHTERGES